MESGQEPVRVTDFYTETVLPALSERLDDAFPEFGWRRDARGWVASNEQYTHARLGVRAERVVAHGPAPRGFLVHGAQPLLWTAYLNGGTIPRGEQFVQAVKELARRAGIDTTPIETPRPQDRQAELLHDFFTLCQRELEGDAGARARAYLVQRGFPPEAVGVCGLGVVPGPCRSAIELARLGYAAGEIARTGLLADSRWPGRLCGAWQDEHGRTRTLWARVIDEAAGSGAKYLYLRGATRGDLPPYGLSTVLAQSPAERRQLVLVEGVLDVHQLHSRGILNVAALGGTAIRRETFEQFARHEFEEVVLCLDRDQPGRAATMRAIDHAVRATRSPAITVIDPGQLAPADDPDGYIRNQGSPAWTKLVDRRECAISWQAASLLDGATPDSRPALRRAALARAGRWLGTLPARLALEQEDAIRLAAERCGYSPEAVRRASHARYWGEPRRRSHSIDRGRGMAIER